MKPFEQIPAVTIDDETLVARLRRRWLDLTINLGADPPAAEKWFSTLRRAYAAPNRQYHNLEHLDAVLTEIDQAGARMIRDPETLQFAAWFHDAVYDIARSDNEERSAAAAINMLSALKLSKEQLRKVRDMILCTRDHRCDSPDGRILVDADLAILGETPERYRAYADAIRREFAAMPDERFRSGRMRMLQSLLSRGKIFQTMRGQRLYEENARRNVAREIAELTMSTSTMTMPAVVSPRPLPRKAKPQLSAPHKRASKKKPSHEPT